MSNPHAKLIGMRLPPVRMGEMVAGELRSVRATEVMGLGASVVVGVPAAFSPVCSTRHLPSVVQNVDRLRQAGFDRVVCVVTSDPFSTEAWSRQVDPTGRVRFFSDRNLSFTRALGLEHHEPRLFLGECSQRYLLTVREGVIETVRVEDSIINVTCSDPSELVLDDA